MVASGIDNLSPSPLPVWGDPGDLKCSQGPSPVSQNVSAELVSRGLRYQVQQVLLFHSAISAWRSFFALQQYKGIAGRAEVWRQY